MAGSFTLDGVIDLKSQNLSTFLFCFSPKVPKEVQKWSSQQCMQRYLGACVHLWHIGEPPVGFVGRTTIGEGLALITQLQSQGLRVLHGLLTTAPTMCPVTPPARDCHTLTHSLTLTHRVTQTHSEADCPLWGGGIASLRPQPQLPLPPWGPSPAWR